MEQLKLNMIPNGVNPVFHASQYDKGRQIRFVLDETLSGAEVTVSYRAKDGNEYGNVQMSVSGNTITDTIPEEVLTDYGIIEGEVNIDGIGSLNFFVEVEKDAYDGGVITTQTATGAIATFETNIETALVSLKADINPIQDLHGYSKPWSGGGGKNKLQITATTQTINGITFAIDNEGVITTSGTFSENTNIAVTTNFFLKAGTYILNGCPSGGSYSRYVVRIENGSAQRLALDTGNGEQFTLAEDTYVWCRIYLYSSDGIGKTFKPMVRLATESDSSFAPYSNICPISGFSALNVTRTGKNLFDGSKVTTTTPSNWGVSFDSETSILTIEHKNTYSSGVPVFNIPSFVGDMVISGTFGANVDLYVNGMWNRSMVSGTSFTCTSGNAYALVFPNPLQSTLSYKVQLELGNTEHAFEPYNGQTATVNFGQTVYGGVVDVTRGKVTLTHGYHQLTGTEDWAWRKSGTYSGGFYTPVASVGAKLVRPFICTHAKTALSISEYEWGTCYCDSSLNFCLMQASDTVQDWKNYLASQYSNGTPVSICYELATPIEITTTPENLTAIVGENNVYGDTNGDTEVEYYIEV